MKFKFVTLAITVFLLFSTATNAQKIDENLRQELLRLEREDQAVRIECTKSSSADEQIKCGAEKVRPVDAKNTKRLEEIFKESDFPGVSSVGKDGFSAFMLLLQHSNSDELRVKSLKPIKKAFRRKELSPSEYTNFVDRLRLNQGKPQLYGAGFSSKNGKLVIDKVADPKNLDKRRKKVGLPPIAEYVELLKETYHLEVEMPEIQ